MNDGNFPRPPPGDHWNMDQHVAAERAMTEVQRRQASLEQQMQEAKLEIIRARRQQKEAQVSRVVMFFFVFVAATAVFYVLQAKGVDFKTSALCSIGTLVAIGAWWVYRKPY